MAAFRAAALGEFFFKDTPGSKLAAERSNAGDSSLPIGCGGQYGCRSLRVLIIAWKIALVSCYHNNRCGFSALHCANCGVVWIVGDHVRFSRVDELSNGALCGVEIHVPVTRSYHFTDLEVGLFGTSGSRKSGCHGRLCQRHAGWFESHCMGSVQRNRW